MAGGRPVLYSDNEDNQSGSIQEYLLKLKKARDFYDQSPDGQYDIFVTDVLNSEIVKVETIIETIYR